MERYAYKDRKTGKLVSDPIYASAFMEWCYNSSAGCLLTDFILSRGFVSRLYGWYYRRSWTRSKIAGFASRMRIDLTELTKPLAGFGSFSEFISRDIDLSKRSINEDPSVCVSPVDGRVMVYPRIEAGSTFRIKTGVFDLGTLLQDRDLALRYQGGSLAAFRLYLADYHHFHFPVDGIPFITRSLAGRYYATSPYSKSRPVPFYAANHRMLTLLESERFGLITMIEIGAFTVGSIRQQFAAGQHVAKAQHKGWFELGGSALVLLFEKETIRFDPDLCDNTLAGVETYVRLGESIGRVPTP